MYIPLTALFVSGSRCLPYRKKLSARHILLNDTSLRATDELDKLVALRSLWKLGLGLIATCLVVELALEEDAASVVDRCNLLLSKARRERPILLIPA